MPEVDIGYNPNKENNAKIAELRPENEFTSRDAEVIYELIQGSGFKPSKYTSRFYEVDEERCREILLPETDASSPGKGKEETIPQDGTVESDNEHDPSLESMYKEVVKSFVQHGVITPQFAAEIGKILRPANVQYTRGTGHHLIGLTHITQLDISPEERAPLEINRELLEVFKDYITSILKQETSVSLTDEQLQRVATKMSIAHEYGHAAELTKHLLSAQTEKTDETSDFENWKSLRDREQAFRQQVFEKAAPNPILTEVFRGEENQMVAPMTSQERIAMGFQYAGLEYALEAESVSSSDTEKLITRLRANDAKQLADVLFVGRIIAKQGGTMEGFSRSLEIYKRHLEQTGQNEILRRVPNQPIETSVGYWSGLQTNELKELFAA